MSCFRARMPVIIEGKLKSTCFTGDLHGGGLGGRVPSAPLLFRCERIDY